MNAEVYINIEQNDVTLTVSYLKMGEPKNVLKKMCCPNSCHNITRETETKVF